MQSPKAGSGPKAVQETARKPKRPTRAQIQAMEARSVVRVPSVAPVGDSFALDADSFLVEEPAQGVLPQRRTGGNTRPRTVNRVIPLTRPQEYAFISEDMRRLLIIGACLLVLMFLLLFVLDRP